jgi:hypothetical protein
MVYFTSASIAVCRSYLSAATKLKERTGAVSMVSLAQVLGFVVGPGEMMKYLFNIPVTSVGSLLEARKTCQYEEYK